MRYLVTTKEAYSPFLTDLFDCENNFNTEVDMVVYDLQLKKYTTNGMDWLDIPVDHL